MSSFAVTRSWRKTIRTILQGLAGAPFTALIGLLVGGLSPEVAGALTILFGALFTMIQNYLESTGTLPVLLPTAAIIPVATTVGAIIAPVAGTVEAVSDVAGDVAGVVKDVTGTIVGGVLGVVEPQKESE